MVAGSGALHRAPIKTIRVLMNSGKVTSPRPLKVAPFGDYPGRHASRAGPGVVISSASSRVVLPIQTRGRKMRFDEKSFTDSGEIENVDRSPRKRQKTDRADFARRWAEARDLMLQAYEDDNDGFPLLLSHYKGDSPTKLTDDFDVIDVSDSVSQTRERPWIDPGPCLMFEIPGEAVLAREKPRFNQYWPAKILRYIERNDETDKEKYEVLYFDGIRKIIPRDMILSQFDDGFATCRVSDISVTWDHIADVDY